MAAESMAVIVDPPLFAACVNPLAVICWPTKKPSPRHEPVWRPYPVAVAVVTDVAPVVMVNDGAGAIDGSYTMAVTADPAMVVPGIGSNGPGGPATAAVPASASPSTIAKVVTPAGRTWNRYEAGAANTKFEMLAAVQHAATPAAMLVPGWVPVAAL